MSLTRIDARGIENDYNLDPTLQYTYIGILDNPPVAMGSSFTEKNASTNITVNQVFMSGNTRLTSIEFTNLEGIVGGTPLSMSWLPALTSISFPQLKFIHGSNVSSFSINNLPSLTQLNIPQLTLVGGAFTPTNMASLTSLNAPNLTHVSSSFTSSSMAALTTLNIPSLKAVGVNFGPSSMGALTSLSASNLLFVGGNFNPSSMAQLTSLSAPNLTTVGGSLSTASMASLTTLSFPSLTTIGFTIAPTNMAALTTIDLPNVVSIGHTGTSGNWAIDLVNGTPALTNFQLPTQLKYMGPAGVGVRITQAALNQESVDNILVRLAALDGTNGTTSFDSRTVTITGTSATPSATGLAAKATLQARGCTVTHN